MVCKALNFRKAFAVYFLIAFVSVPSPASTGNGDKSKNIELHDLENDELLSQAQTILVKASEKFLAKLRGVKKSEFIFEQARKKTNSFTVPDDKPGSLPGNTDPAEAARIELDRAKARLDALNQLLKLVQREKSVLDQVIGQLEDAQSAANSFSGAMDRLELFLLEIRWRTKDGTLAKRKVPRSLSKRRIKRQIRRIASKREVLEKKLKEAREELDKVAARIKQTKTDAIEVEALRSSAEKKHALELKRKTLEEEYSAQEPGKLLSMIPEFQEERIWLKGAFNLSYTRFVESQTKMNRLMKKLEKLSLPESESVFQPETTMEPIQAAEAAEKIIAYHRERIEKLEELGSTLESLARHGDIFEGDATVLNDHLFKMQVLAKVVEGYIGEGKIKNEALPDNSRSKLLAEAGETVSKSVSEVSVAVRENDELPAEIEKEITKSNTSLEDTKSRLAHFKETYDSVREVQQWDSELKTLSAEDIIKKFSENGEKLEEKKEKLKDIRKKLEKKRKDADRIAKAIASLKDPLMRLARQESSDEKCKTMKSLYEFAEIKLPEEIVKATSDTGDSLLSKEVSELETEAYQNLLSSRSRTIEERQKHRKEMKKELTELSGQIEKYISELRETRKLAMRRHTNAVELKKRLGRRELDGDKIPAGITDALKRDFIDHLDFETKAMSDYHESVGHHIKSLDVPDKTVGEIHKLLTDTLTQVGKRVDTLKELEKLDEEFDTERDSLSSTELKAIEQTAIRQANSDDSLEDDLLAFVPSRRASNLTELLHEYYMEIIELDKQGFNIKSQKDKTEYLINLLENEKTALSSLFEYAKKKKRHLEVEKEKEWAKIKAGLAPKKAGEIVVELKNRTGCEIPVPSPIAEKDRKHMIEQAAATLCKLHIEIVAIGKWIDLYQRRLSMKGIGAETGTYQDKLGELAAKESAIQRRILSIKGNSNEEWNKLGPAERPVSEIEKLRFLKGEIGVLREDRNKIRHQVAIEVLIKVSIIFIIAVLFTFLANIFIAFRMRRAEKTEKDAQTFVILRLMRSIVKFVIWLVAVICALYGMGFDVGAILAGLGIGGLAIAMASKETLGNILGGIMIFTSKPFKVGDLIRIKGYSESIVKEIGLRSTRLEDFMYNTVHIVPNAMISESIVENISAWPGKVIFQNLELSQKNSPGKMELAVNLVKESVGSHKESRLIYAKFHNYKEGSHTLRCSYNIEEFSRRHIVKNEVNLEINRRFMENGIEFADLSMKHRN